MDQSLPDTVRHTSSPEAQERVRQLIGSGQVAEADMMCRHVLRVVPDDPEMLLSLAKVADERGERPRAILLLEQSAGTGRASWEVYNLLCHLYRLDERPNEARVAGHAALGLPGVMPVAPLNLARVYLDRHEFDEAAVCLLHALALDPDYAPARVELGHLLLRKGEFTPGWADYAWLFRLDHMRDALPKFNAPEWNGMRLPKGRILLVGDQGYGDTMQFARYIPRVRERVGDIVIGCSPELLPLISSVRGVSVNECFTEWTNIPGFSAYCPLSSLPRIFETKLNSIPASVPYLKADPVKVARWAARLTEAFGDRALYVGVAWAGRPTHWDDRQRSLKWAQLRPLTRLDGVALISLQKEIRESDRPEFPGETGVLDLSAELSDFSDTAAVIENLDLVVTVDSSVAHLAGALAKPVWVMLPWLPDWRWLMNRADSPWYPTMRLFRQSSRGDWSGVIARVARGVELGSVAHRSRRSLDHKSAVTAQTISSSKRGDAPVRLKYTASE
jgi:tetratricopeptide (TPR) repeat protein